MTLCSPSTWMAINPANSLFPCAQSFLILPQWSQAQQPTCPPTDPPSVPSFLYITTNFCNPAQAHQKWSSYRVRIHGSWCCQRTGMVLNRALCLRAGEGTSTDCEWQEHKWGSKQAPAQAKPWPIGSTGKGGRELRMQRGNHKPTWKQSTEGQDGDPTLLIFSPGGVRSSYSTSPWGIQPWCSPWSPHLGFWRS